MLLSLKKKKVRLLLTTIGVNTDIRRCDFTLLFGEEQVCFHLYIAWVYAVV